MKRAKFKSDAFEAIHSVASGMERAGVIKKQTMREYDAMCIAKPEPMTSAAILKLRRRHHLSQPVFASFLNVSASTVEKWESGDKKPSGAATRLLSIVEKHGIDLIKA